ncbi:hypothetical protein [Bdellovibrio bacteriovorus]|uniref:hypothetical protein n=1 Tax=Bdellovibrio bacteriovorus TaxID=959 RepID=UPI00045C0441|nr:hypothetical protein [Bdellovibrio bacteriovorus]AHZ84857.1 hypothetical protein EP01_07895 [Bdellovibrio bacteriovorus]BEV68743.1 hypothetical protein Bb109J_c2163 [Bdellovibrio bacteriovorus]
MKLVLHSLVLIACVPLIAIALEPTNPAGFCERFIGEKEINECHERTKSENVDWYAATVCHLQQDDKAFWACWDSIQGQSYNPAELSKCGENTEASDTQRQSCIDAARGGRKPASVAPFQPLKLKK